MYRHDNVVKKERSEMGLSLTMHEDAIPIQFWAANSPVL